LLRHRCERPGRRRAAEQRHELAAFSLDHLVGAGEQLGGTESRPPGHGLQFAADSKRPTRLVQRSFMKRESSIGAPHIVQIATGCDGQPIFQILGSHIAELMKPITRARRG
jgi:hypothetical protein